MIKVDKLQPLVIFSSLLSAFNPLNRIRVIQSIGVGTMGMFIEHVEFGLDNVILSGKDENLICIQNEEITHVAKTLAGIRIEIEGGQIIFLYERSPL